MNAVDLYSDEELFQVPTGNVFVFDTESYPNFWCLCAQNIVTKKGVVFRQSPDEELNTTKLRWMLWRYCFVGFNSLNYDMPMIAAALTGIYKTDSLNELSFQLIGGMRPRDFEKEHKLKIPLTNHIDLIQVAPLKASLKLYGGRLHCPVMQDLPYDPYKPLTEEQAERTVEYCFNDLTNNALLLTELSPHIQLRQDLSKEYGRDLRSLSDAQVAEAIINTELYKASGMPPRRPEKPMRVCKYTVPGDLHFQTPILKDALAQIAECSFHIDGSGKAAMPASLSKLRLNIGRTVYKLGMGGLHSQEKEIAHVATDDVMLIDRDVASYYPRIILNQELYPQHLGRTFLNVFRSIVDRRLAAKAAGNKKISEGLKIAINGIFGKMGNIYSTVYSPDLLLQVTLSGQLYLLMLIEMIELAGIPVVSGNTDGIVIKCPKSRYEELLAIIKQWEQATRFETEETRYKGLYSRDVNNYIAVKQDGKCKTKGVYSEVGTAQNSVLSKNCEVLICSDAIQKLLTDNVPVEKTITECTDVKRFVAVRHVNGGAEKNGRYLGKAIRWYYAKGEVGCIEYRNNGNKVPKTEGAKPCMELPACLPSDLDLAWYIREANEMLFDLGYYKRPKTADLFFED